MQAHAKNIFLIHDSLENRISYYHLLFFVVMLPFDRFYSEIVLISFAAHVIIHLKKEKVKAALNFQTLLLTSAFLINLLGTAYSPDKKAALNDLERQLSILLFPVLISVSGLNLFAYIRPLLTVFSITCVATIIYLFAYNLRLLLYNHLPVSYFFSSLFTNHNFSAPIQMHATYLAMYVGLSIAFLLFLCLKQEHGKTRIFYYACILILSGGLIQLASRSVFIATILFIGVLYPLFTDKPGFRTRFILITLPIILVAVLTIYRIDGLRQRYTTDLKKDLTQASVNNEINEPRIERWRVAWKLVQKSPYIGYGSGAEKKILMDQYFDQKLYGSYLNKLNAHNQYLSILLKTGVWGLVIFLFTLSYGFAIAWINRDIVFAGFMTLITVVSFSENILDVNKTIFFYSFFFSILVYSSKQTNQRSTDEQLIVAKKSHRKKIAV